MKKKIDCCNYFEYLIITTTKVLFSTFHQKDFLILLFILLNDFSTTLLDVKTEFLQQFT